MRTEANRLFDEFNRRYWRGRLPTYRVIRRATIPGSRLGSCSNTSRTILLHRVLEGDELRLILLHEMCHIGPDSGYAHGPRFLRKLRRLVRLGAPKRLQLKEHIEAYDLGTADKWKFARYNEDGQVIVSSFRSALWNGLVSFAMDDPYERWAKVSWELASQCRMSPAQFQRAAPWAKREWQQVSGDYRSMRRAEKEFRAKFLPLDKEAKP